MRKRDLTQFWDDAIASGRGQPVVAVALAHSPTDGLELLRRIEGVDDYYP